MQTSLELQLMWTAAHISLFTLQMILLSIFVLYSNLNIVKIKIHFSEKQNDTRY